jgi:hypothetical protein
MTIAKRRRPYHTKDEFVASKSGCSAMDVSRQHRLKYETAWTWLHKLRSCMAQFGRAPLSGSVEVDETYLGGEDDAAHKGRSLTGHKTPVAAAVEKRGEATGRIRLIAVLNATALSLCGFVRQNVAPGAHVMQDDRCLTRHKTFTVARLPQVGRGASGHGLSRASASRKLRPICSISFARRISLSAFSSRGTTPLCFDFLDTAM